MDPITARDHGCARGAAPSVFVELFSPAISTPSEHVPKPHPPNTSVSPSETLVSRPTQRPSPAGPQDEFLGGTGWGVGCGSDLGAAAGLAVAPPALPSAAALPDMSTRRGSSPKSNSTLNPSPSFSLAPNGLPAFEVKPSTRTVRPSRSSCPTCCFVNLRPATVFQIVSLQPSRYRLQP